MTRPSSRHGSLPADGQVCGLLAVDIAGFTSPDRDGDIQLYLRRSLYDNLQEALQTVGVAWEKCHHEDRGDGVLVVLPEDVSLPAIIDPLAERLATSDLMRSLRPPVVKHLSVELEILGFVAELSLMLWLLVRGVDGRRWAQLANRAAVPAGAGSAGHAAADGRGQKVAG